MSERGTEIATNEMNPGALIQYAVEKGVDAATMERLFGLAERLEADTRRQTYAGALRDVQQAIAPVVKRARNDATRSSYARLEDVDEAIRPIYTEAGFSVSFGTEDSPLPEHVRMICDVWHTSGHRERYHADLPLDVAGIKGQKNKTDLHATGSTYSYGRRYLLAMVFNVVYANEDDDGQANTRRGYGRQQEAGDASRDEKKARAVRHIWATAQEKGWSRDDVHSWLHERHGLESASEVTYHQYKELIAEMNKTTAVE